MSIDEGLLDTGDDLGDDAGEDGDNGFNGLEDKDDLISDGVDVPDAAATTHRACYGTNYNDEEVNEQVLDVLHMKPEYVAELQNAFNAFLKASGTKPVAGEAIYGALFEAAPSLQNLFKTPRAVQGLKFINGIMVLISSLGDPKGLKILVETLSFQHLALEVTAARIQVFREAVIELFGAELGAAVTIPAVVAFRTLFNYVGGAFIFVRRNYAGRLQILSTSWATANNRHVLGDGDDDAPPPGSMEGGAHIEAPKAGGRRPSTTGLGTAADKRGASGHASDQQSSREVVNNTAVPTTYAEMFRFNAAVMGFAQRGWMVEVLTSFDAIVTHAASGHRLQEECDVLSLRLGKHRGNINLTEYKAVMLASLRSLVPKDWDSEHEVAWSWLWENIERLLRAFLGKSTAQEKALAAMLGSYTEKDQAYFRREIYTRFFKEAPNGMDSFKQSITRLHFIADKVLVLTLEMYKEPYKMVDDLSALGLRHVGYGIATELLNPFVSACVEVVRILTEDELAEEAFRWSLSLISRIMTRVVSEGSTLVMRAINANSGRQLKKAVSFAPRCKRADTVLNITVGSQSISPLLWSISAGSLEAAKAILTDLLTIRADRDRYYFGLDALLQRHPDIVRRLCVDAPILLPDLLDGMIWRSRLAENGLRRVIYFVKHLITTPERGFAPALEWLTDTEDPKLVCHPVVVMVTDLMWSKVVMRRYLSGKTWFLFTLIVFITAESILPNIKDSDGHHGEGNRIAVLSLRIFVYAFSLLWLIISHVAHVVQDCRKRRFVKLWRLKVPAFLAGGRAMLSVVLAGALALMLVTEPILHCWGKTDFIISLKCEESDRMLGAYDTFVLIAMICYYTLLTDLSVFSTQVSAFCLVVQRVLAELALSILAWGFIILLFASAIGALEQTDPNFSNMGLAARSLLKITLGQYGGAGFTTMDDEVLLLLIVFIYGVITIVFLLNLLIAQLSCAYGVIYQDMVGLARLQRGKVVVETVPQVPAARWKHFLESLHLDLPCEFGEGDIGLAGGILVLEPSNAHVTTVEMIKRYGGTTSGAAVWPEEELIGDNAEDRLEKLERFVSKSMKRIERRTCGGGNTGSQNGSSMMNSSMHTGSVMSE